MSSNNVFSGKNIKPNPKILPSSNLPYIHFVENKGQWNSKIKFQADLPSGSLLIENNTFHLFFRDSEKLQELTHGHSHNDNAASHDTSKILKQHYLKFNFKNASSQASISGQKKLPTSTNYFKGNDPKKWGSNCGVFNDFKISNLYSGIDVIYSSQGNAIKYQFEIAAGKQYQDIVINIEGANSITKTTNGGLEIVHSLGTILDQQPLAWQVKDGVRKYVKCNFVVNENNISFNISKNLLDNSLPLIIDPVLVFSSYTGSVSDNWGYTATYDEEGNLYSGGIVFNNGVTPNDSFPVSPGAFQSRFNGGDADVVIFKFNKNGTQRLYATYIGGSQTEVPISLVTDKEENLYILGTTGSPNFPVSKNAFDTTFNGGFACYALNAQMEYPFGSDNYIFKLNNKGTQLLGSTFIGGSSNDGINHFRSDSIYGASIYTFLTFGLYYREYNYGDDYRGEIILDKNSDVIIVSNTKSKDIPLAHSFKNKLEGTQDGVLYKFSNNLDVLKIGSYIGGNKADACFGVQVNSKNEIYTTGVTMSTDLITKDSAYSRKYFGQIDGFAMGIYPNGDSIIASTYIGTDREDLTFFVQTDSVDNVIVLGQTWGTYSISDTALYHVNGGGQFIHSFDRKLQKTNLSTTIGSGKGSPDFSPTAFLVNNCGAILLSGWFGKILNPVRTGYGTVTFSPLPITPDAFQKTTDRNDFYVTAFTKGMKKLEYGTYFGGVNDNRSGEHVDGGTSRFDKNGVIYQAFCSSCSGQRNGSPTTQGVWSETNNSLNCNLLALKMDFIYPVADLDTHLVTICKGDSIQLKARGGAVFNWLNASGLSCNNCADPFAKPTVTKTFQLKVENAGGCVSYDSVIVRVQEISKAKFDYIYPKCSSSPVQFNNLSQFGANYWWNFGVDSITTDTSLAFNPQYQYPLKDSTYKVTLITNHNYICQDTSSQMIKIANKLSGSYFSLNDSSCIQTAILLSDSSKLSTGKLLNRIWKLNDTILNQFQSNFVFNANKIGTKTFKLIIENEAGCKDSVVKKIVINPNPELKIAVPLKACLGDYVILSATTKDKIKWQNLVVCDTCLTTKFLIASNQKVKAIAINIHGCQTKDSSDIKSLAKPKIDVKFNLDVCNNMLTIDNQSTNITTHDWNFNDLPKSNLPSPTHQYATDNNFQLVYIASQENICFDTLRQNIKAFKQVIMPDFKFDTVCQNLKTSFVDMTKSINTTPVAWFWINGSDTVKAQNPQFVTQSSNISLLVKDKDGCQGSISHLVSKWSIPFTTITVDQQSQCSESPVYLSSVNNYSKKWFALNQTFDCDTCAKVLSKPSESTYYKLQTISDKGCKFIDSAFVFVRKVSQPELYIVHDSNTCINTTIDFKPILINYDTLCRGKVSLKWDLGNGKYDTINSKFFDKVGEYEIVLKLNNGQTATEIIRIKPLELCINTIFIPNAFTPNLDGNNDILYVRGTNIKTLRFRLFNRWGEEIFRSTDLNNGWNGYYKGERLAQQVFVYTVEATYYNGEKVRKEGNVTLID